MSPAVPSRQALRALRSLCHPRYSTTPSSSRPYSVCACNISRPTSLKPSSSSLSSPSSAGYSQRYRSTTTTIRDAPEAAKFQNDPAQTGFDHPMAPEPKRQGTEDPQHTASTNSSPISAGALPDITNFYTLFPQTIPQGPPKREIDTQITASTDTSTDASSSPGADGQTAETAASFYINPRALRKEFLQLQAQHHPDKFPSGTPAHTKAYALSTLLNNAYKTLSDPLLRAQYLLQLNYDVDVMSEDNSAYPTDQETLMDVMEAQEAVEDAGGEEEIERLKEQNLLRMRETEEKVGKAFEKDDSQAAIAETVRLKYWVSLQQGLNEWEPGKELRLVH